MFKFLRTTLVGGFLFLLPIGIIVFFAAKMTGLCLKAQGYELLAVPAVLLCLVGEFAYDPSCHA
jgi:hypothetical protein